MKNIYAIRDLKTNYGNPVCDMNDEAAKRGFMMAVEYGQNELSKMPQDFELVKIGTFDEDTGEIVPCAMEIIITGFECLQIINSRKEILNAEE